MNATTRIRIALASAIILATPASAGGQSSWVRLSSPADGVTLRVDTSSILTIGDSTFGSFRWTGLYPGDTTDTGIKYAYVERDRIAACRTGRIALEAISYYTGADTIIDGTFWEAHEWQFSKASSGSSSEVERNVLCSWAQRSAKLRSPASPRRVFIVRPKAIQPGSHNVPIRPMFAGFRIGQPLRVAKPLVGLPLHIDSLGEVLSLSNSKTGVTLLATPTDGVGAILATSRNAGSIDGVRVGDSRFTAIARWGSPAVSGDQSALWLAGNWVISASFDTAGCLTRLGIGQ